MSLFVISAASRVVCKVTACCPLRPIPLLSCPQSSGTWTGNCDFLHDSWLQDLLCPYCQGQNVSFQQQPSFPNTPAPPPPPSSGPLLLGRLTAAVDLRPSPCIISAMHAIFSCQAQSPSPPGGGLYCLPPPPPLWPTPFGVSTSYGSSETISLHVFCSACHVFMPDPIALTAW